jgi:hypothetical protein
MTTRRFRNRVGSPACIHCGGPVPATFRVCDACTHPEHAKRRAAGKRDRAAEAEMRAVRLELSPYSQRVDAAISELERHASRSLKLAIDADAGVTALATKKPRATAIAGASTGTHQESSDG